MKIRCCHLALTAALLMPLATSAETFRCGQWIASKDMSVEELLEKCGEPATKSVRYEDNYAKSAGGGPHRVGTSTIATWQPVVCDGRHDRGWRDQEHGAGRVGARMIARLWHGRVPSSKAASSREFLNQVRSKRSTITGRPPIRQVTV